MTGTRTVARRDLALHCRKCFEEVQTLRGVSLSQYARLNVLVDSDEDLLVWCVRHETLVASGEAAFYELEDAAFEQVPFGDPQQPKPFQL